MTQLAVRELEQFLAVAEELHFTRAAVRLRIAQPALSKTIRRMEARLGVQLLVRTSRHVELTPAGRVLLRRGRQALDAMDAAVELTRQAGAGEPGLRLVIKPGGDADLLSAILAAYADQPGAHRVEVVFGGATDRADHLLDGRADLALLYDPFDSLTGLESRVLRVEPRVALLPRGHRLAAQSDVLSADLEGEMLPRWTGLQSRDVADRGDGPEVADRLQLAELILLGRMVAVLPESLARTVHPALVRVPVTDAPPSRLVLAWHESDHRPEIVGFVTAALRAIGRSTPTARSEPSTGAAPSSPSPR